MGEKWTRSQILILLFHVHMQKKSEPLDKIPMLHLFLSLGPPLPAAPLLSHLLSSTHPLEYWFIIRSTLPGKCSCSWFSMNMLPQARQPFSSIVLLSFRNSFTWGHADVYPQLLLCESHTSIPNPAHPSFHLLNISASNNYYYEPCTRPVLRN